MKTRIQYLLMLLMIQMAFVSSGFSQDKKIVKVNVKVAGVCNQCKDRIENAALVTGVKAVSWSKETQSLEVIYRADKTNLLAIEKAVAEQGHDTEHVKATDDAYAKLHHCCKYREGQAVH